MIEDVDKAYRSYLFASKVFFKEVMSRLNKGSTLQTRTLYSVSPFAFSSESSTFTYCHDLMQRFTTISRSFANVARQFHGLSLVVREVSGGNFLGEGGLLSTTPPCSKVWGGSGAARTR